MSDLENQEGEDHIFYVQGINDDKEVIHDDQASNVTKITHDGDYITFGNERYLRSELVEAFGGNFQPGLAPPPKHQLGNPAPLGLSAFAVATLVQSFVNVGARGVHVPNIQVSVALFYGFVGQLIAGLFEIVCGNTFGAVGFTTYAGFWGSYSAMFIKSFGIQAAYIDEEGNLMPEFEYAVGLYCVAWFIFSFFMMLMTLKSTVAFFSMFFFITMTFLMNAIFQFTGNPKMQIAGGAFGFGVAFCGFYNAYAGLATPQNSYFTLKAIPIPDLEDKSRKHK